MGKNSAFPTPYIICYHYFGGFLDILTSIDGLNFKEAFTNSQTFEIDGIPVHVLSTADLIKNKRATGRTKDLADAESLEEDATQS